MLLLCNWTLRIGRAKDASSLALQPGKLSQEMGVKDELSSRLHAKDCVIQNINLTEALHQGCADIRASEIRKLIILGAFDAAKRERRGLIQESPPILFGEFGEIRDSARKPFPSRSPVFLKLAFGVAFRR
jgi:hypothetical protein